MPDTMTYSWSEWVGSVMDTPDPVQAWFNKSSWPLDRVEGGSDCANITAITSGTTASNYIWQCAIYPNITDNFRQGMLSEAQESSLTREHIDTSLAKAVTVTLSISSCLAAYCESLEDCKQKNPDVCSVSSLSINGSMLNRDVMDACMNTICASHPEPLTNTDIAGIGIVISYIIQIGIPVLGALYLMFLTYWQKVIREHGNVAHDNSVHGTARWQTATQLQDSTDRVKHDHEPETEVQQSFLRHEGDRFRSVSEVQRGTSRSQEIYDAIMEALVDFLKAQCFVAIAISTAALIMLNSETTITLLDFCAVGAASGVCIIPVTFNYYVLATFNTDRNDIRQKSWYLYILSLCAWVLGLCVVLSPQMFKANLDNKSSTFVYLRGPQYPNACGNISPVVICPMVHPPNIHPEYAFYYTLCVPVMLGLTIWQLSTVPSVSRILSFLLFGDGGKANVPLLTLVHLAALGLFVAPLVFLFTTLNDLFYYGAVSRDWTFGQVIGVTVWIPSLTGLIFNLWINNLWSGIGRPHTTRLPIAY